MATDKYFDKFPIVTFANNQVVDITRRVTISDRVSRDPYTFHPYDINSNERPDQFSNRYYDDPHKSWLLYLSNKINDPYYEWYLSEEELDGLLEKKYSSVYDSKSKTYYYRNNWESQEDISVSAYNALSIGMRKYWQPNYSDTNSVMSYSRKEVDWVTSTNKVISYTVANTSFTKDEICDIYLNSSAVGKGQVTMSTNTHVYVQHVTGDFQETDTLTISSGYIYGNESQVNTAVTEATTIYSNIDDGEFVYWKPITYYDHEYEQNEYNRSIRVMDSDESAQAVINLRDLLEE